jgi:quinoprotein glucose dehydrogenase
MSLMTAATAAQARARHLSLVAVFMLVAIRCVAQKPGEGWPTYGGDPGGTRFSHSSQITRNNLDQLRNVWTFHTHSMDSAADREKRPSLETTPVLWGDTLYLTSPFDDVFAVDARTGSERWHYTAPRSEVLPGEIVTSRGVALWPAGTPSDTNVAACAHRVFVGTLDAHLLALDTRTGRKCVDFGDKGSVDLTVGVHHEKGAFYGVTSPPTVVGNVVIVGSSIADSEKVDVESGAVRAYDAISGKRLWIWEPLPWATGQKLRTGSGNVWSVISADPALGLVYLPTGSASLDYYAANRPGDDRDANSIVALDAATGKKIWAFQVVHHDVWDYDIPSEPVLFTWRGSVPAVAVTTKMGMIFILDRRTGTPLVPVEERRVPQSDVPGEQTSPTQPFQAIPPLAPLGIDPTHSAYQRSPADEASCRSQLSALRYEGIYTPPSLRGTLYYPGNIGGVNWGGAAIDPSTGILYANTNRQAFAIRLVTRYSREMLLNDIEDGFYDWQVWLAFCLLVLLAEVIARSRHRPGHWTVIAVTVGALVLGGDCLHDAYFPDKPPFLGTFGSGLSAQRQSPYLVKRTLLVDSKGHSCTPAPWGAIAAINLNTLAKVWEKPLGTMIEEQETGIVNFGGPIVTGSGLIFTAAAEDPWLRVFDAATGDELKKLPLPLPGQATPMTYTLDGVQYVVVAAGGHDDRNTGLGDSVLAFAIK